MTKTIIKKVISLFLIITMLSTSYVAVTADNAEPPVTVFVDGKQIMFDVEPIIENGRTLVPMRFIFEALGAEVEWINETNTAVAVKGDIKIEITIDSNQMLKNGAVIELDVPAKLLNDRTLVPVRAVSEGLGAKVNWDGELYKVIITSSPDVVDVKNENTEEAEETDVALENNEESYEFSELSPDDVEKFKSMFNMGRYTFEQSYLLENISPASSECAYLINIKDPELPGIIGDIWNNLFVQIALQVQIESEDNYVLASEDAQMSEDEFWEAYTAIVKSVSLDADSIFSTSYVVTPKRKNVLLVEFYEPKSDDPMMITCKYIAIVPDNDGIRYLTVEASPVSSELLGEDIYMFCEVTTTGRRNYGIIDASMDVILEGIDSLIDG